ncbi:MAG: ComEA family DNA-binding protein [Planctomycetaceae bacterium]
MIDRTRSAGSDAGADPATVPQTESIAPSPEEATRPLTAAPRPQPAEKPPPSPPVPPPGPPSTVPRPWLGLRRADQLVIGLLAAVVLALMLAHWGRMSSWGARPVEIERHAPRAYEHRLDINSATWVEWIQLEGVGETLARRIIEDREANGPFESVDDLQRVNGIGPKTIEKLRPYLHVEEKDEGGRMKDEGSRVDHFGERLAR